MLTTISEAKIPARIVLIQLPKDDHTSLECWKEIERRRVTIFDIRNTRSGSVADEYLKVSKCEYLVSDVFSGYSKAVRQANAYRESLKLALILHVYCNAHARRKFKDSEGNFPEESKVFIANYREIYCLENEVKKVSSYEEKLSPPEAQPLKIGAIVAYVLA